MCIYNVYIQYIPYFLSIGRTSQNMHNEEKKHTSPSGVFPSIFYIVMIVFYSLYFFKNQTQVLKLDFWASGAGGEKAAKHPPEFYRVEKCWSNYIISQWVHAEISWLSKANCISPGCKKVCDTEWKIQTLERSSNEVLVTPNLHLLYDVLFLLFGRMLH